MPKPLYRFVAFAIFFGLLCAPRVHAQPDHLDWNEATELPDATGGPGGGGAMAEGSNLGMAGPYVGVARDGSEDLPEDAVADVLIVAGGANFPIPEGHGLWDAETYKRYYDTVWVLSRKKEGEDYSYTWLDTDAVLPTPRGYGATVSTDLGVLCVGGINQPRDGQGNKLTDAEGNELDDPVFADAFIFRWNAETNTLTRLDLPPLPAPSVNGAAAVVGDKAYILVGQTGPGLDSASDRVFALDLSRLSVGDDGELKIEEKKDEDGDAVDVWEEVDPIPGGARAYAMAASQHNGRANCLYVIGGRRNGVEGDDEADLVPVNPDQSAHWLLYHDVWELNPGNEDEPWRQRADITIDGEVTGLTAGSAVTFGIAHIFVVAGSDGTNLYDAFGEHGVGWGDYYDENGNSRHVGFNRSVLGYHAVTDAWSVVGQAPTMDDPESGAASQIAVNAVTTQAVLWGDQIFIASGEVRPKVRSPKVWAITVNPHERTFGALNMSVLVIYLLAMVGVGVFFAFRNKNTNDYFRGGQHIPWWAAACSIYATMLSSLTFTGLPSYVFSHDWVYFLGVFMILCTAPIAIYIAMPFFRQIDATSAYEYLSKRFNLPVRLFGSALFTVFHISRMGIVMALTALAISIAIPGLETWQSVLIMGVLCLIYCTLGGIEAVIWTDTIQTVVLLGGAILCLILIISGIDGGVGGYLDVGMAEQKFKAVNWDFSIDSYTTLAIWVIILGGMGQNIASYTSDQAVVQRYMTTPDKKLAARSIWTNALMAIPGSLLFFGIGTALYVFYKANPAELDPTMAKNDQIFPLFIVSKVPAGLAGLIIAGIFAAAQSTVSTSMNSTATTIVTDFLRPFNACQSEKGYLNAARFFTFLLGVLGTCAGLLFISPEVRELLVVYFKVIGMFMGLLAGLFALGVLTKRANGWGALFGVACSFTLMMVLWKLTKTEGYIYATITIIGCFIIGYLASLVIPGDDKDIDGLTIYTRKRASALVQKS